MMDDQQDCDSVEQETIPFVEWIVAAVGAALVMGTISFLIYRGFSEQASPSFRMEIQSIENQAGTHAVTILVHNQGGRPVAELVVRGSREGQEPRELTIDFLPANSARAVTFLFGDPIRPDQFVCEFTSYNDP